MQPPSKDATVVFRLADMGLAQSRWRVAGTNAFTIIRLAGHSGITFSERYVHPTGETIELASAGLKRSTGRQWRHPAVANSYVLDPVILLSKNADRKSLILNDGPVAQRLEQGTHNPLVGGSNPSGPTRLNLII
jgi:hypothetical protein